MSKLAVVILVIIVGVIAYFVSHNSTASQPQGPVAGKDTYICSACGKEFVHDNRTVNAWAKGARSFYCRTHHAEWRARQQTAAAGGAGCGTLILTMLILGAVLTIALIL
ncbi:MAG: hypothetical protein ACYC5Y_10790 [Symbiobacteriia bacterium]